MPICARLRTPGFTARTLAISLACSCVCALPPSLIGALAVQMSASLQVNTGRLGAVAATYYFSSALGSIPLSRIAGQLDGPTVMKAGCLLMGLILGLVGWARGSWLTLIPLMTAAGLCNAWTQPAINQYLADQIPRRRQGVAFGVKQSSVPMTTVLGGLAVPTIALTVGWRWALAAAMLLCALVGSMIPARRSRSGADAWRPEPCDLADDSPFGLSRRDRHLLSTVSVATILAVGAGSSLPVFAVSAAVAAGLSPSLAGVIAATGGATAVVIRIVVGFHIDRRSRSPLKVAGAMLTAGAVGFALLGGASAWEPRMLPAVIVLSFSAAWGWNGLLNLAVVQIYSARAALATGITNAGGNVGGVVGPLVFGVLAARLSYSIAWLFSATIALAGGAVYLAVDRYAIGRSASESSPIASGSHPNPETAGDT